ncbi:MAG: P1 family peptidase [Pseudomonadota bacterium]
MKTGQRNLITDVPGLTVGNAQDETLKSGVTTLLCERENRASVHVMGGAPGTRDTELLSPHNTVEKVDALCLSGGSAFGLDAATGVQSALREQGKGFAVAGQHVPIVPAAILFDLINGGDKDWGRHPPYRDLGYESVGNARPHFDLGSVGAGTGALVGSNLKGGLGSASTVLPTGHTIGALVAVNALGSPTMGDGPHFWAAPFEIDREFGGLGMGSVDPARAQLLRIKFRETAKPQTNTTIGIIATDAPLTKAQCQRLAMAAHDGFARALWPAHTPLDGDLIFAISVGELGEPAGLDAQIDLSAIAASTMSRAVARGVYEARAADADVFPTWVEKFGSRL